jgi:hypothetical protein
VVLKMPLIVTDKTTGKDVEVYDWTADGFATVGPPGKTLETEFVPIAKLSPDPHVKARSIKVWPKWLV